MGTALVTTEDGGGRDRYGALAGVVFVVLDVVVAVVGGEPLAVDAPVDEVVAHYTSRRPAIGVGLWLFGLASVALLWWFGSLYPRLVRTEQGVPRLAIVSLMGLVLAGALSLTAAAVGATLALRVDALRASAVGLHVLASGPLYTASGFGLAAHLLATTALGVRSRLQPRWLVALGVLSAVGFLASAVLGSITAGSVPNAVGLGAFALWCLWILGVSREMWSGR